MGRLFKRYISNKEDTYRCNTCKSHLSSKSQVISKSFHGRGGRAFLMDDVINVYLGPDETRMLVTGMHIVADINCIQCHELLGWKYKEAHEESQVRNTNFYCHFTRHQENPGTSISLHLTNLFFVEI